MDPGPPPTTQVDPENSGRKWLFLEAPGGRLVAPEAGFDPPTLVACRRIGNRGHRPGGVAHEAIVLARKIMRGLGGTIALHGRFGRVTPQAGLDSPALVGSRSIRYRGHDPGGVAHQAVVFARQIVGRDRGLILGHQRPSHKSHEKDCTQKACEATTHLNHPYFCVKLQARSCDPIRNGVPRGNIQTPPGDPRSATRSRYTFSLAYHRGIFPFKDLQESHLQRSGQISSWKLGPAFQVRGVGGSRSRLSTGQ